jgi:hypothetical protein
MMPYWLSLQVTREAVLWALVWAVLSATVAGVVPALRITGKKVQRNIQRAEAGRSGIRFGGVTSALIMADVAISVVVVGVAVGLSDQLMDTTHADELTGIPAHEYLAVELRLPSNLTVGDGGADIDLFRERLASTQRALVDRLEADPGVRSVAVADALPRMDHCSRLVEVEGVETPGGRRGQYTRTARVDVDFFEALNQPILTGRGFEPGDLAGDVQPVIVNTVFVDGVLGALNPIGRRLRFVTSGTDLDSPWHEIIGVVGHLGMYIVSPEGDDGVYLPVSPGGIYPLQLGLHVGASPESFTPRLREIVAEVNPDAILGTPKRLSSIYQGDWYIMLAVTGGLGLLVVILIVLAASGIYAIMSFSVSERTREIGIRTALGAQRRSLVITVLRRSLTQIAVGALVGMPMAAWILIKFQQQSETGSAGMALGITLALGVTVVTVVALFSCVAPTRRLLSIGATTALRAEG